jgi:hypothetical protein
MSEQQFEELNSSELAELARKKFGRREGSLNRTSLLKILSGEKIAPTKEEETRKKLQIFVGENWEAIQTNIPCSSSVNAGKCTKHNCSTVQHIECYKGAGF